VRAYEMEHVVGLEETNVVGNVYFAHFVRWQGRCRELFLREHAPDVLDELGRGLRLVTTRVSCEYFAELEAFDAIVVRMRLARMTQSRVAMTFDYLRRSPGGEELVARGAQEIACIRVSDGKAEPGPVPPTLREALQGYASAPPAAQAR
jgi:enediyne core biosynthesis thioesterase